MNVGTLFFRSAQLFPEKTAVIQGDHSLTYEQLKQRALSFAGKLVDEGIRPGERVMLLMDNDYRFVECLFGTLLAGAVIVPLNIKLPDYTLQYICDHCEGKMIFCSTDFEQTASDLVEKCDQLEKSILLDEGEAYESWLLSAQPVASVIEQEDDDFGVLMYTSGSTGRPKGCMLTHGGKWWMIKTTAASYWISEEDVSLIVGPLYHANALWSCLFPILWVGGTAVIMKGFDERGTLQAISRYRPTYTSGTPAMFSKMLAQKDLIANLDQTSIEFLCVGSAPVSEELLREMTRVWNCEVLEGYGLTEGGIVSCVPRWGVKKLGSIGLPFKGGEVRIVEMESGRICEPGQTGELWIKNPALLKGYLKQPDVFAQKMKDGWLKTGDLVLADEQGYLYFKGRKDDMINCGGENVYPKEVETLLLMYEGVAQAAVVPAKHAVKGEAPVAWVVPHQGARLNEQELKNFTLEKGPAYAHPRRIFFVEALPMTGSKKIDTKQLMKDTEERLPNGL